MIDLHVREILITLQCGDIIHVFEDNDIDYEAFMLLTESDLRTLIPSSLGKRVKILNYIQKFPKSQEVSSFQEPSTSQVNTNKTVKPSVMANEKNRSIKPKLEETGSGNRNMEISEKCISLDSSDQLLSKIKTTEKRKKEPTVKNMIKRKIWQQEFSWLAIKSDIFFCKICQKSFKVEGRIHLKRHEDGKLHKKRLGFPTEAPNIVTKHSSKIKTEAKNSILLKLLEFLVEHDLPFTLLEHLIELLSSVCSDSKNSKQITWSRAMGQEFIDNLEAKSLNKTVEKLKTAKFSLIIDETIINTSKCLVIIGRYFDDDTSKVQEQFLGLSKVSTCTAAALYTSIIKFLTLNNIPQKNMIGLAADNVSVMMGNLSKVQTKFREVLPYLFVIGCTCHSFYLCASAAYSKLPENIKDLVQEIYSYFSHSCKRLEQFAEYQKIANLVPHRLLHPSQTRWLSLESVFNTMLIQWKALIQFFEIDSNKDNLQSATVILKALQNPINQLYLQLLSYILGLLNSLNQCESQNRETLFYSMLERVTNVYKKLLKSYLNNEYVSNTRTHLIDPENKQEYKPIEQLNFGDQTSEKLTILSSDDVIFFKVKARNFYIELCKEIRRRIEFNDPVLPALSVLNPKTALSGTKSIRWLTYCFPNLVRENTLEKLNAEWKLLPKITNYPNINLSFEEFINWLGDIKNQTGNVMFPTLHRFIKDIACLPHSSIAAERIFFQLHLITKQ